LIPCIRFGSTYEYKQYIKLTWGGLHGGLSVALALSLRTNMYSNGFMLITYIIVLFSILVQGLTIGPLAKKLQNINPQSDE